MKRGTLWVNWAGYLKSRGFSGELAEPEVSSLPLQRPMFTLIIAITLINIGD